MFEKTFSFWRRLVGIAVPPHLADVQTAQDDRRVWVRYETDLQGTIRLAEQPDSEKIPTTVSDLSLGGANLLLDRPFQPGQILSLEMPTDQNEIRALLACVVRAISSKDGPWSLGCVFSRELSGDELSHFGAKKVQTAGDDLRRWVRFSCEMKAHYRKVGDPSNRTYPAQVLNISASGIGLAITPPMETGCLLNVDLMDKQGRTVCTILACVVHTTRFGNGELALGCNFIRELNEEELQSLL